MTTAISGNTVSVHYVGTFDDGEIFDSSRTRGEPITFQLGSNQVVPGFESAILGMSEGETKSVTLEPEDAYGPIQEDMTTLAPLSAFPEGSDADLVVGSAVYGTNQNGEQMTAIIKEIDESGVTLDFNHPLAGKSLTFKIELVNIQS